MSDFRKEIKQGAVTNFLGILGKIAGPTLLIMINQLYGTDIFGIYLTANMLIEIVLSFLTSGFKDGTLIFVSKYIDDEKDHHLLYQSISNAIIWSLSLGIIALLLFSLLGKTVFSYFYEQEYLSELIPAIFVMGILLPIMAIERIIIASTQGLKIMKYEALSNGALRPTFLLLFSLAFYFFEPSVLGIAYGYFIAQFLVFLFSIYVFKTEFSVHKLVKSFRTFRINRELIRFSIPQSFNATLTRFITGIDVLMLPAFGASALQVGIYGTGASIIREIRQIKLAFSASFNPHIVKFFRDNEYKKLSEAYSMTANWISSIAIPIIMLMVFFHAELINLISSVPVKPGDAQFMLFLLPVPYLYTSFSLAGNIIVMTGKSHIVLMNSFLIAFLNVVLNSIFIPLYGLNGAALASSLSVLIISCLEIVEAWKFGKTSYKLKLIYQPHLSGLIAGITIYFTYQFISSFPNFTYGNYLALVLGLAVYGLFLKILPQNRTSEPK